jgi:hypothetical protein
VAAGEPKAAEVRQIAARLPARAWRRYPIKEGSKGPIEADFAFVRVTRARRGRPGRAGWLVLRRSRGEPPTSKCFLSNAPVSCARAALVRVSGLRWPVETALEEAQGELGMDHYETRTWRGWHHQMTQRLSQNSKNVKKSANFMVIKRPLLTKFVLRYAGGHATQTLSVRSDRCSMALSPTAHPAFGVDRSAPRR